MWLLAQLWVFGLICVSLCPLVRCGNDAHLKGGSDVERVRSTLSYGWVERCSDVAGCETNYYKISNLVHFTSAIIFSINECDEHVEFLYESMFASTV